MKELYPLTGIVTVLNTPFKSDQSIDLNALQRHVQVALQGGVAGFLVPAMASEVYKLSEKERLAMVYAVLEAVEDRVPVIAGAGETDLGKSKKLLKAYIDLGIKHVLFQIPYQHDQQFRDHFMDLASLNPEMIMLQDWDSGGNGLKEELILELFESVESFRCLKIETQPAGIKYSRMLELTDGKLNISGGWAVTQMIEGLQRGVHAFMPTAMHPIYCRIYALWHLGKKVEATALFDRLIPVLAFSNQHLDISIHFFKRLLHRQGIYPTDLVRDPALPFDNFHRKSADRLIDLVLQLESEIIVHPF